MDEELRKKIEAVLFSVGKSLDVSELMKMIKESDKGKVTACLIELKKKYNEDENNSLMILQDGESWKLTIKDQYIDVAKEIGVETELSKTIMETLAVIAYKNPVLQSEVIKIRTNNNTSEIRYLFLLHQNIIQDSKNSAVLPDNNAMKPRRHIRHLKGAAGAKNNGKRLSGNIHKSSIRRAATTLAYNAMDFTGFFGIRYQ